MPPPELVASDLSLFTPELEIPYPETPKEFAQLKAISKHLRAVFLDKLSVLFPKELEQHRALYETLKVQEYCFLMALYNARNMYHLSMSNQYIAAGKSHYIGEYLNSTELWIANSGWTNNPQYIPEIPRPTAPMFNWPNKTEALEGIEEMKRKGANQEQPDAKGSYNKVISFDKFKELHYSLRLGNHTIAEMAKGYEMSKDAVSNMIHHRSCKNHWAVFASQGECWNMIDLTDRPKINLAIGNIVKRYMELHRKHYKHLNESQHEAEEKSIMVKVKSIRLNFLDKETRNGLLTKAYKDIRKLMLPMYKKDAAERLHKMLKKGTIDSEYPEYKDSIVEFIDKHKPQAKRKSDLLNVLTTS